MNRILLHPRKIYGKMCYYPACDRSMLLASLGNRSNKPSKVFAERELEILKQLGYEIEYVEL